MSAGTAAKKFIRLLPLWLALAVLAVMTALVIRDSRRAELAGPDLPPFVDLTWTPLGPLDLKEFRGRLTMADDRALDFRTYRFRIVELDRTLDMPIEGLVGREYQQDIYLGLIADDTRLAEATRLTLEVSIADDAGQTTAIRRVVRIKH